MARVITRLGKIIKNKLHQIEAVNRGIVAMRRARKNTKKK